MRKAYRISSGVIVRRLAQGENRLAFVLLFRIFLGYVCFMRSKKGNFAMRLRPVLALSLWLVAGTVLPTGAQPPPRQTFGALGCDSSTGTVTAGRPEGHAIVATVKRVDTRQGQLEFTTETGSFLLTAPPAEMHNLRVGDQLLICLHEDIDKDKERLAEDRSTAIPKTP